MELRDIEYFAVVAEHGNVRRASEALDLSPPALSKSLRRLERSLQAKLVMRTAKGIELTPVGTALLSQVRRIRLTLNDVAREAADLTQGRTGHLRVAASPAVGEELPAAFAVLKKDAPEVTLKVATYPNLLKVQWLHKAFRDRGLPPPRVAVEARSIHLRLQTIAVSNLGGLHSWARPGACPRRAAPEGTSSTGAEVAPACRSHLPRRRLRSPGCAAVHRDSENGFQGAHYSEALIQRGIK